MCVVCFFFFKQKTAYEMRISDWSSDVCPSDLILAVVVRGGGNVGDFIGRIDTANAADDPKFSDVLHGSLLWISVADGFFAAELSHAGKLKMGGSESGRASGRERVCQYV